jgi:serine/threonine protein kinase
MGYADRELNAIAFSLGQGAGAGPPLARIRRSLPEGLSQRVERTLTRVNGGAPHESVGDTLCCSVKARRADRFSLRVERLARDPRRGVLAMTGTLESELSGYAVSPLREGDFPLYRGSGDSLAPVVIALAAEQPSPQSLRRLEREYSLAAELDPAWAPRPLALTRHEGRTILVLQDPGGEPMDRILDRGRGQLLELTRFLGSAIGLAAALGQVHRYGQMHKDIEPANVLVDLDSNVWLTGFGIASRLPRERQSRSNSSSTWSRILRCVMCWVSA